MAIDTLSAKQHAHQLVEELHPGQVMAVVELLQTMVHGNASDHVDADDELSEEDRQAIAASREYFQKGGEGLSFEQVVAGCGFTMDEILDHKAD